MKCISSALVFLSISLATVTYAKKVESNQQIKKDIKSQKSRKSVPTQNKKRKIQNQKAKKESRKQKVASEVLNVSIGAKNLFVRYDESVSESFSSENKALDMEDALKLIKNYVSRLWSDNSMEQFDAFAELRSLFSEEEFSSGELMAFIDDAMEIKNKYPLILEFVVRSEYARKAEEKGIAREEALQLASSEYIFLPKFILYKDYDITKMLNETLMDLGCGVLWKDRMKYMFVLNKYFGKRKVEKSDDFNKLPRRVQHYFLLLENLSKLFESSYNHLEYKIAQDFYYGDVPEKAMKEIFCFSKDEWNSLITPKNYN